MENEKIEQVITSLRAQGYSRERIAEAVGRSIGIVAKVLRERGLTDPKRAAAGKKAIQTFLSKRAR